MSKGKWEIVKNENGETLNTEVIAIHLAMMRTRKVLMFSGNHEDFRNLNAGMSRLLNMSNKELEAQTLNRNLFCAGHCFLPDGRLLVAGGQSWSGAAGLSRPLFSRGADLDVHTFDPADEAWTRHNNMSDNRWYPTCTTLPSGSALIISGLRAKVRNLVNKTSEVFNPATNQLSTPFRFLHDVGLYPFVHILPDGFLFIHYRDTSRLFDWNRGQWLSKAFHTVPVGPQGKTGTHTYNGTGSCTLLPLDGKGDDLSSNSDVIRILLTGGSTERKPRSGSPATDVAQIFEFNRSNPENSRWRPAGNMKNQRFMSDATLLPDGKVFVSGGARFGKQGDSRDGVLEGELFDPIDESWHTMAQAEIKRLYHSTALLLPDRRVLVAGSTGHHWPADGNEFTLEAFIPEYCRNGFDTETQRLEAAEIKRLIQTHTETGVELINAEKFRILKYFQLRNIKVNIKIPGRDPEADIDLREIDIEELDLGEIDFGDIDFGDIDFDGPEPDPGFPEPDPGEPGGTLPEIREIPFSIQHGSPFDIVTDNPDAIESVFLVRSGSVTHTTNMDQRLVALIILSRSESALTVAAPKDGWVAPPGWYMAYLVGNKSCVSEGKFIRVDLPEWSRHPCSGFLERLSMLNMAHSAYDLERESLGLFSWIRRSQITNRQKKIRDDIDNTNRELERCTNENSHPPGDSPGTQILMLADSNIQTHGRLRGSRQDRTLNNRSMSGGCVIRGVFIQETDSRGNPSGGFARQIGGDWRGSLIREDETGSANLRVVVRSWNSTLKNLHYRILYRVEQPDGVTCSI